MKLVGLAVIAYVFGVVACFFGMAIAYPLVHRDPNIAAVMSVYTAGSLGLVPGGLTAIAFAIFYGLMKQYSEESALEEDGILWLPALLLAVTSTFALTTVIGAPFFYSLLIWATVATSVAGVFRTGIRNYRVVVLLFSMLPILTLAIALFYGMLFNTKPCCSSL